MRNDPTSDSMTRLERGGIAVVFAACLLFNLWGVRVGWQSLNLPGHEFRQAQTALSALFIQQEGNFSIDYPTPALGKPWAIPLEFPLYQWTVVAVDSATQLGLTKSGRLVSLACFYLMLPALFLMLGRFQVAPIRRWLVLAVVLTSPLYIYYGRSFLIETMALMFGLWFWVAYEKSVSDRSWAWLIAASLTGTGAGLVKVTTFIVYLLPPFGWAVQRLWQTRAQARWKIELPWLTGGVILPLAVSLWWERHADATRLLNPLAHFLGSDNLTSFTLGTWPTRLSPELWGQKWETTAHALTSLPALIVCALLGLAAAGPRRRTVLACVGFFGAPLAIFPVLYGWHDYYFTANGVLLLVAMGLALVGLSERGRASWLALTAVLVVVGTQAWQYREHYFPAQSGISQGGDALSRVLMGLTKPDEVVVMIGQEWNPMFPYYAQRRMMMIRHEEEKNIARLDAAFAVLKGERVGALAIAGLTDERGDLVQRAVALGINPQPIFRCQDMTIYLREDRLDESTRQIKAGRFVGVNLLPGAEPIPEKLAGSWYEVAQLPTDRLGYFLGMNPKPIRFYSSFGPGIELAGGRHDFGAHPFTRLVFPLSAGGHELRTTVSLPPIAYQPAQPNEPTSDGVEIAVALLQSGGLRKVLYTRLLNPRDNPADRGKVELRIPFRLELPGEVELFFGPGPAGRNTYDWIVMGDLVIE